jgi:ribosomal protein L7Ae-like RNA K-turn-binding protein
MMKEKIIETVSTQKKAGSLLKWYREVEKRIKGNKKFVIKANGTKFSIVMIE